MAASAAVLCVAFVVVIPTGLLGQEVVGTLYPNRKLVLGVLDKVNGAAYGIFNDTLQTTGWGSLYIKAGYGNSLLSDGEIMFAAGFLEGAFTADQIYSHYINMKNFFLNNQSADFLTKLKGFLSEQEEWTRLMSTSHGKTDVFWNYVGLVLSQYDGLMAGYNSVAPFDQALDIFAFQLLNGAGDLLDLVSAIDKDQRLNVSKITREELKRIVQFTGRCSALIKVMPAFENLYMAHSSWFTYSSTNRIFKYYDLNVRDENVAAKQMAFSSYPGYLESLDDFYLLSSGLVMLQTTNNIFNDTLYDHVHTESVLAWIRVRVANMVAKNGLQWSQLLARENSGTYNNQYMIIDLSKIELNTAIQDGALYVVEQIPTLVAYGDQTEILRAGYWASYNVPFYEQVYNLSGYPDVVKQKGVDFSYMLAPRAKIFRRDQASVTDLDSLKKIMRYNDYKRDPYSEGDSCDSICCRGDLLPTNPRPSGCYDTKVSDYGMAKDLVADTINGPTVSHDLPVFGWSDFPSSPHIGLPNFYNFPFIRMQPIEDF